MTTHTATAITHHTLQMTNTIATNNHPSNLSNLVNADRLRSSIKRLFHNEINELISEVLQNSQRACATRVDITTTDNSFIIEDNGHGLIGGVEGFHTLLKLAESSFDNNTIEDQDPMGLGIVSLLTHDQINQVTFSSGTLQLTIDTKRWWNDPDYYKVWYERLVTIKQPIAGLRITAHCPPELARSIESALKPNDAFYTYSDEFYKSASPAQGYESILSITLNSMPVRTSLPAWTKAEDPLISTTYLGSKLTIGYNHSRRSSSVLWYGQLIPLRGLNNSFDFHLEVASGRPINPLSPSRKGIIQDTAYRELLTFVSEQLFTFIFDIRNRPHIKPVHVETCFQMNKARATTDCPYIVADELQLNDNPSSVEDFNQTEDPNHPHTPLLFTYDDSPLLLEPGVTIQQPTGTEITEYGLSSFIPQIGTAYTLLQGDYSRLKIGELWWKPEGNPQHNFFFQPGSYGISYDREKPPAEWLPVTHKPVFAFNETSNYDAAEVDFTVGTDDIMAFLHNQIWAGFGPNDESNYDTQEDSYRDSISDIIRAVIGNCVPLNYTLYDLRRFLNDQNDLITSVTYRYKQGGENNARFVNPKNFYRANKATGENPAMPSVTELTVNTASGEKVRLKLY